MKVILIVISLTSCLFTQAQITDTVVVDYTKSAYLLFASEAIEYDCGSEGVLVRKAGNRLIIQAGIEEFEETNLFVSVDGQVFMFIVEYGKPGQKYIYDFSIQEKTVLEEKKEDKELEYEEICKQIVDAPNQIMNRGVVKYKLGMYLRDLVIYDDKLFFKFEVTNNGNIPYEVDYSQYLVKSIKRKIKGASFQEIELTPLMVFEKPKRYEGLSTNIFVVVMDKFALTENKKMVVEQWENNGVDMDVEGGRKIVFNVFSRDVLNVRVL